MRFVHAFAATALLFAVGGAFAASQTPEQKLAKVVEGRVAGTPVHCIYLPSVRDTQIIHGTAIVYDAGSTIYVNHPANGAKTLRESDVLVTKSHGTELCNVDIVRLVDSGSHSPRGFVHLGDFVPYKKVRTSAR
jgi:hypothetical protein